MRVLEFGSHLAAPLAGHFLVDAGLEVVCVLRPRHARGTLEEDDYMRHMTHDLRRGKTVVELDLATTSGLLEAHRLIRSCDVVLENFGPGVATRIGIGYDACRRLNGRVVYVSMPGFSHNDRVNGDLPAWDSIIMASTGVFSDMGLNRTLRGISSSFSALPMPSVYGAIFASLAVVTALFNREEGGDGQFIEVPLASALSEALVHNSIQVPLHDRYRSRRAIRIRDGPLPVSASTLESLLDPFFCKYECRDGRPVYLVCPAHVRHQRLALECLGLSAEALGIPVVDPYARTSDGGVHGIGSGRLSERQCEVLRPRMVEAFRRATATEWERIMGGRGVPLVAHRSADEWCDSSHARESGLVGVDERGRRTIGALTWTSSEHFVPSGSPSRPATLGAVRVLDLCNVIAGPTIGAMMARMGAHVTKVDPVRPLYAPDVTVVYGLVVNIGKQSVLLDVASSAGRDALHEMIRGTDVILLNATADCAARLGMDEGSVRALNPEAILLRFDAWGGPRGDAAGEMSQHVGYDDNVQAGIGIMERFGGGLSSAEEHAHVGTIDVIAGVAGAFGAVAALLHRKRSGWVRHVHTSLAAVGQYLQYPFMFGRRLPSLGRGVSCIGVHAGHRIHLCTDGALLLVDTLLPRARREARLRLCPGISVAQASLILKRRGIATCLLRTLSAVVGESRRTVARRDGPSYQYLTVEHHPLGCLVLVAPVAIRSRDVRYDLDLVAPRPGTHTTEVVSRLLTRTRLIFSDHVSDGWSKTYIPTPRVCDVCGEHVGTVSLSCEHSICCACLETHRHAAACPRCGRPHILDRDTLRSITTQWRRRYAAWRRGSPNGSTDMERLFRPRLGGRGFV